MKYLTIRNWDKWQTYRKDRGQPPWIKLHRCVMRDPQWVSLTDAERGQLVAIWLLAADHDGVIPASPELIQKLCYMNKQPDLNKFTDLGFIVDDWRQCDVTAASTGCQHDQPDKNRVEKKRIDISSFCNDGFDIFWKAYPRKVNKKTAIKVWAKLKPDEPLKQKILSALEIQKKDDQWTRDNGKYIPHPSTWLNQERWNDDVLKPYDWKEEFLRGEK